jgi:1-acyl-sn-glycerol-3-phosphate acyltransferase
LWQTPGTAIVRLFARALLFLVGWRLVGRAPDIARCVVIFAPHTSNWDFPLLLLVRSAFGRRVHYLGKHTLFRPPFGWFFRATGGIPVVRHERRNFVKRAASFFAERRALWLAMSPEGTRDATDHWKSGFYRIALAAGVPVLCAFVDAATKECGLGPLIELTGDTERDLAAFRAFYQTKRGIDPDNAGTIRFKVRASRPPLPPKPS